jgi:hypothetical protein
MKIKKLTKIFFFINLLMLLVACNFFDPTPKCDSSEIQPTLESLLVKDMQKKLSNNNLGSLLSKSPDNGILFLSGFLNTSSEQFQTTAKVKISFNNFIVNENKVENKRSCSALITYKMEKFDIKFNDSMQGEMTRKFLLTNLDIGLGKLTENILEAFQSGAKIEANPSYASELDKKLNKIIISAIPVNAKVDFTVQKLESNKDFYINVIDINFTE